MTASSRKYFVVIGCSVLDRELSQAASLSPHKIEKHILSKGLHDIGCVNMRMRLQEAIDAHSHSSCDAVLLGYALCNLGIAELKAPDHCPLVVTRAHDCITLFMGSRQRYADYFAKNPGTYFLTPGWVEHGEETGELRQITLQTRMGMNDSYEELVAKYGEDNAQYLWEELHQTMQHYSAVAYIDTGVAPPEQFEPEAQQRARSKGWKYDRLQGDLRLLQALLAGEWKEEDFLVVPPGQTIQATYDDSLVRVRPPA